MKKLLSIAMCLCLILSTFTFVGITASAYTEDYYTYSVSSINGAAEITDCDTSIGGDITIPSTLGGYPVTSISYRAFEDCTLLASVTIPDSVKSIGNCAFENCTSLTSITIPDSVKKIEYRTFYKCTSLTSITIPDSVKSIGSYAFYKCTSLTSITIPDSSTTIDEGAFCKCTSLTSVMIPNSVVSIGEDAFYGCNSLTSVTLPDGVTSIGKEAFFGCDNVVVSCSCDNEFLINYLDTNNIAKKLNHNNTELKYDENGHWYQCSKCTETSGNESHVLVNHKSNNDATCTENATETGKCAVCGKTDTRQIENTAFGHEYSLEWTIDIESTCTTSGEMSKHCVRYDECGARTDVITVPAKGHTESDWEIVLEATDTQSGIRRKICVDCKITLVTEYYEKHQHSFSSEITTEPTCENNGIETFYCQCGESYTQIILSKGHTIVTDKSVKATCTKTGLTQGSHCSICNEVFVAQEVVKSLGHKYKWVTTKKATYFAKGTSSYKCTACGKVAKTKSIAKLVLKKPTFKLTGAKGKFTVKYTKVTGATGFEVRYKLGSGKYKTVKVNTKKSISKVISKLKKGKYTVQVRAFVKSGSKTAYSSWAKAKTVKVK